MYSEARSLEKAVELTGVPGATRDTITGIFWSHPPLHIRANQALVSITDTETPYLKDECNTNSKLPTLNPNLPFSSGFILIRTIIM